MAASDAAKALLSVLKDSMSDMVETPSTPPVDADFVYGRPPSPMLSVSTDGMLMAEATGYTQSDMAPDMIEGWRGAMLTNAAGDTAVVYSDIGNDGETSLLDRYSSNLPTTTSPRSWLVGDATGDTASMPIPWTEVRRPDDMTTVGGSSGDPITMFKGSVHGVPGTFSCNAAEAGLCTAPDRYSDDTVLTPTTAPASRTVAWVFVPDEDTSVTYLDDKTFLTFGWWLSKGANGKPDDLTLFHEESDALGDARTDANTPASIRGKATYKGGAAGKYAMASATDDTYSGGHFTAMATLMVDFDVDNTPAIDANDRAGIALSGMIDNFMTGDMARPGWMVKLMVDGDGDADSPDDNSNTPLTSLVEPDAGDDRTMTTMWSTGTAQTGSGMWDVTFTGGTVDATTVANSELPMVATGAFDAHIGGTGDSAVGRLQGAFAAGKMMDP